MSWLRAAGEPSRFRLLVLCGQRDLSVSDLALALGQSEPRVSRHLRILCESGLIERHRHGQWVHYRLATDGAAAGFVQGLLAQVDRADSQISRDLDRALARPDAPAAAASESRLGRALKGFVEIEERNTRAAAVLVVGVEHPELLQAATSLADECTAIAHSRRAAQSARAYAERHGFNCRVLLAASTEVLGERDLERAGRQFDAVVLDHPAASESQFGRLLACARRALTASGRIWLFERYESLESSRDKVVEHPLARLRRLLGDVGLHCERLSPIEADGQHVLAAAAVPAAGREHPGLRRA
ncbi:MAG TPA: metalloregulator ArsR/SmtB family transcription factor [Steroidobacteraceae bacterium]|nr:metalloregulator ArsR/SmtB family transcription factor [Steroidobacteraceae bacterium]